MHTAAFSHSGSYQTTIMVITVNDPAGQQENVGAAKCCMISKPKLNQNLE